MLINNIAFLLRRLPLFAIHANGEYRLQPVSGQDVADIAVRCADQDHDLVVEAAGPDILTYNALVKHIRLAVGSRSA
ncbi:MAG TPA: epimerase, partial [Chloroflexota bacterium]